MKPIYLLLAILFFGTSGFSQTTGRNIGDILQSYYLFKDKDVVEKSIDFVNKTNMTYNQLEPIIGGFYGALFEADPTIKEKVLANLEQVESVQIKEFLVSLSRVSIDSAYAKLQRTTDYNDMNWASYFASGNLKYVDNIISNIRYADERENLNLFLAGSTAEWSLCSNAIQDKRLKKYLISLKDKVESIDTILAEQPNYFREKTEKVLKEQRLKGLWK